MTDSPEVPRIPEPSDSQDASKTPPPEPVWKRPIVVRVPGVLLPPRKKWWKVLSIREKRNYVWDFALAGFIFAFDFRFGFANSVAYAAFGACMFFFFGCYIYAQIAGQKGY